MTLKLQRNFGGQVIFLKLAAVSSSPSKWLRGSHFGKGEEVPKDFQCANISRHFYWHQFTSVRLPFVLWPEYKVVDVWAHDQILKYLEEKSSFCTVRSKKTKSHKKIPKARYLAAFHHQKEAKFFRWNIQISTQYNKISSNDSLTNIWLKLHK